MAKKNSSRWVLTVGTPAEVPRQYFTAWEDPTYGPLTVGYQSFKLYKGRQYICKIDMMENIPNFYVEANGVAYEGTTMTEAANKALFPEKFSGSIPKEFFCLDMSLAQRSTMSPINPQKRTRINISELCNVDSDNSERSKSVTVRLNNKEVENLNLFAELFGFNTVSGYTFHQDFKSIYLLFIFIYI